MKVSHDANAIRPDKSYERIRPRSRSKCKSSRLDSIYKYSTHTQHMMCCYDMQSSNIYQVDQLSE